MTREEKIQRYIDSVIEGMDWKTMCLYIYESIEMYKDHFYDE